MSEITEQDVDRMNDAEIEHQEIEARKIPNEKIMDLLKHQQLLLENAMITCQKIESELRAAQKALPCEVCNGTRYLESHTLKSQVPCPEYSLD